MQYYSNYCTVERNVTQYRDSVQWVRTVREGADVKVAVANLKGGTAKTMTSFFLAAARAKRERTLLVDTDPQGSAL